MNRRSFAVFALAALTAAAGVGVSASDPIKGKTVPGAAGASTGGATAARITTIVGVAWTSDNRPIAGARLRLRNTLTGRIAAVTVANEVGRFRFTGVESATYVVELVSETGKILTTGHPFAIAAGETVATFVRLGTKVPWYSGFFSNAAAAVATTAASTGITALAPEKRDVSPSTPASGQ